MLRKVFVASLSAALVFATSPGFACTGISLKAEDGAAIRARTLEFGFPMQSNVLIVPAGQEFSGTLPDGGKGLTYTSKYAVVGANAIARPPPSPNTPAPRATTGLRTATNGRVG